MLDRLYWKLVIWIRQIRGRCIVCRRKLDRHPACPHCAYPDLCHWCGKRSNFFRAYGGDPASIMRAVGLG